MAVHALGVVLFPYRHSMSPKSFADYPSPPQSHPAASSSNRIITNPSEPYTHTSIVSVRPVRPGIRAYLGCSSWTGKSVPPILLIFHGLDLLGSHLLLRCRRSTYFPICQTWDSSSQSLAATIASSASPLLYDNNLLPVSRDNHLLGSPISRSLVHNRICGME